MLLTTCIVVNAVNAYLRKVMNTINSNKASNNPRSQRGRTHHKTQYTKNIGKTTPIVEEPYNTRV
ncbi:hypothetical protein B7P43_G08289 [Cryptotermes secundus]|uniref:Uncharacterized protein n=1 Tax=Cryptotermes secundus TaxID=105785 RepID=A0A2J7QH39_9NEOP|nr:hypothetical protein B7P43_G08289 [Cryptotermes secundus]